MNAYFMYAFVWLSNPEAVFAVGPVWQTVGAILLFITVLQCFSDKIAGGLIFSRKGLWVTFILDALFAYLILVCPLVPASASVALLVVIAFLILAFLAWKKWH